MTRSRSLLVAAVLLLVAGSLHAAIYAVDEVGSNLYTIDPATGAPTLVAPIGMAPSGEIPSIVGLGWDSSAGTMYISDLCASNCGLGTIDLGTGSLTFIGLHAITDNIHGLAYDANADVLYGANTSPHALAVINRATGAATNVGDFDAEIDELAWVPTTDTLYGSSDTGLYTVDRTTGEATLVGTFGATTNMRTITWDPSTGTMYGSDGQYGDLYRVNLATGAATLIGDSGIRLDAIESAPGGAALPTDVPALDGSALALLALLLAACGVAFLRLRA